MTFLLQNSTLNVEVVEENSKRKWKRSIQDALPVAPGEKITVPSC